MLDNSHNTNTRINKLKHVNLYKVKEDIFFSSTNKKNQLHD